MHHFRGVLIAHIVRRYAPYSWVNSQILRMIQYTSYVGAFSKLYSSFVCRLRGTYFCVLVVHAFRMYHLRGVSFSYSSRWGIYLMCHIRGI